MSNLGDMLRDLIRMHNVSVNEVASYCDVDTSNFYKFTKGKRIPSDKQLSNIIEYLGLSQEESEKLVDCYKRAVVGEDVYDRRREIYSFINTLDNSPKISGVFVGTSILEISEDMKNRVFPIYSQVNIKNIIYDLIRNSEVVRLIMFPTVHEQGDEYVGFTDLFNLMSESSCEVRHIFSFEPHRIGVDAGIYNIRCIRSVFPMCLGKCNYHPRIFYNNFAYSNGDNCDFPVKVITENGVVTCDNGFSSGVFYSTDEMIRLWTRRFDNLYSNLEPFISYDKDYEGLINAAMQLGNDKDSYDFAAAPTLVAMLTRDVLEKYIYAEIPDRERLIDKTMKYIEDGSGVITSHRLMLYTHLDGFRHFMETGRIEEAPTELYRPLDMSDRIRTLRSYIRNLNQHMKLRLLRRPICVNASDMSIDSTYRQLRIFIKQENGQHMIISFNHVEIVNAFYDFMSTLDDEYVYSEEVSVKMLEELIGEYENRG